MEDEEKALEELKLLQPIIARQDEFKAKTKSLSVTLLLALSAGYFSGKIPLEQYQFIFAAVFIGAAFWILEAVYGATEIHAEERVEAVEGFLRGDIDAYSGPAISKSLVKPISIPVFCNAAKRSRTSVIYGFLVAIAILAGSFVAPRIEQAEQGGADQPATAPESKPEGDGRPQQESEGRSK